VRHNTVRSASRLPPALKYPAFVRLWAGSIVSSIGTQMNNVAKVWLLYQLTHSAAALGLEGLCFSLPIAVLPLVAGPVVDHLDRLLVIKVAQLVEMVESVALAAGSATNGLQPWMIYLAAAVAAARLSFAIPASTAVTPALVSKSALLSAMSMGAIVWSSSALIGPALAGLLLASAPAATVFVVNGLSTLAAFLALVPVTRESLRTGAQPGPVSRPAEGVRYLLRNPRLPVLQTLVFITNTLLIGTETLLPVLDVQVWNGGTVGYGLLRTAPGIAAVVAGLTFSLLRPPTNTFHAIMIGVGLACAGLVCFVRISSLGWGFALLSLATFALVGAQILVVTSIQQDTPDRLRGAVGGVTAISQSGLAGMAAAAMAVMAAAIGAPAALTVTVAAAAPVALACAGYAGRRRQNVPTVG